MAKGWFRNISWNQIGIIAVIITLIYFLNVREGMDANISKIAATGGHAYSDGTTLTIQYIYSPSKVPGAQARAAIRKIEYEAPTGIIGVLTPTNTDRNIPPSNSGDSKWILPPPSNVDISKVHDLKVTSYVYYVTNTGKKTGEMSDDIVTPVLLTHSSSG